MSTDDAIFAILIAIFFAALFATLFDLSPVIAKAMVRQASRWWKSDLDTPEELAEEWEALIEARPVGVLKIATGLRFLTQGALRQGMFALEQRAEQGQQVLLKLAGFNVLIWLSGARKDILAECPTERPRYTGIGATILITATMATVSMSLALRMALHTKLWVALPFAVFWGLAILCMDRFFVVSMQRQGSRLSHLFVALPRLALSILLGLIISTPFVLQVFEPEIGQQIVAIHQQRSDAFFAQLATDPLSKKIDGDRVTVAALEHTINSAAQNKTAVAQAVSALPTAERALQQDENAQVSSTVAFVHANAADDGLLIRLQALNEITSGSGTLNTARWLLFVLFMFIDCMPVLVKVLMLLAPESLYERLLADERAEMALLATSQKALRRRASRDTPGV